MKVNWKWCNQIPDFRENVFFTFLLYKFLFHVCYHVSLFSLSCAYANVLNAIYNYENNKHL